VTLLLAGVCNAEEAETAIGLGADMLDLADAAGGALAPAAVAAIVRAIAGRRPAIAAIGDASTEPAGLTAVAAMAATRVPYVRVGLPPDPRREDRIRRLVSAARNVKLVGVIFAEVVSDAGALANLLVRLGTAGFAGAVLEPRGAGRLLDRMDVAVLARFVAACRAHGLIAGFAGSLEPPDIPRLLPLAPGYLGFHDALRVGGERTAPLDAAAFRLVRDLIPPAPGTLSGAAPAEATNLRRPAARGHASDPGKEAAARNRIFVHDFVLPVRIGAYAHERDKAQRVRFNVDVEVLRPAHPTEDLRDVFSYDVITDGIRMIVAQEHVTLIEMLAERIAALVLSNARVCAVTVRVEKLDVGPGAVGVEIRREGPAEMAGVRRLYPVAAARGDKAAE
jgi:dihydroneopterin aldolase